MLAGTGVSSQLLESKYSIAVPTTQLFMNYFLLGVVFGTLLACRKNFLAILRKNWWKYLILGVTDVEANYVVVLAYKYTTLTSIQVRGFWLLSLLSYHFSPFILAFCSLSSCKPYYCPPSL